ncbi:IS3 family transposase [Bacillus lacus]|uniref:IS3 family transposase n=1 Tax=Metabacillus lacus TaxID=1983721 RepID=A0A7X2M095_9BACI|nr:IS3 family transposase [Metabacillus lacus]
MFEYIEFFYNSKRIQSTLDYHTPNEFEQMNGNPGAKFYSHKKFKPL